MHHHCEVWLPDNKNIEAQVREAMAPYCEDLEDENKHFWDWWQIGGRWKGTHVPDYEPDKDPDHTITCRLCKGTGLREDMGHWEEGKKIFNDKWAEEMDGCNSCQGTGKEVTWPTEWSPHPKDIIPVKELPKDFTCATLVLPGEVLFSREYHPENPEGKRFLPTEFGGKINEALAKRHIDYGYLVTVDYHS